MAELILQTKLNMPPLRAGLVPRPRLMDKLNVGLRREDGFFNRKLTLVSAPAGFGKTTLVSYWLQENRESTAWISLDEGDNEANRFIMYLLTALHDVHGTLGRSAIALLQAPQPRPLEALVTLLINDLNGLSSRVILVLDDYHVIREAAIHKAVTFLLSNQPPQLHLVVVGREDPPLPMHRLRVRGEMAGIFVKDLRFSAEEAGQFLNKTMGMHVNHSQVAALKERTEGWVAGLQLAALSIQEAPDPDEIIAVFTGDDRFVVDYLLAEVFEHQSPSVREFLLRTAILDRFCGPLCETIAEIDQPDGESNSASSSGQAIIDRLDRANLFVVPLDNKREWYRYHHLFADFLRLRLMKRPATDVAELHRRAAAWYARNDLTQEAIHHYLAARDLAHAADLIERVGVQLIVQGQQRQMLDWLAGLSDDFIDTRPMLCVCRAWVLIIMGQPAASDLLLHKADQGLASVSPDKRATIQGLIDMLRAYQARRQGHLTESIQFLGQALNLLSPDDRLVRSTVNLNLGFNFLLIGNLNDAEQVLQEAHRDSLATGAVYINLIAIAVQGNCHVAQGRLHRAIGLYQEAIDQGLAQNSGRPFPLAGYAYAGLGQVMYEQNQVEIAEELLMIAVQLGESIADWSMMQRGLLPLAWLKQMAGESDAALALWKKAMDVVRQAESERVKAQLEAQWAQLHCVQMASNVSALVEAVTWAETYRRRNPDALSYQEVTPQMTLARVELAQGQVDKAISRLNQLEKAAAAGLQRDNLIKIRALQSLAYAAARDELTALERLSGALMLAEPEGYQRTFIDLGLPMRELLQQASRRRILPEYVALLLTGFPKSPQSDAVLPERPDPLVEPLSETESQMLRLMAAGLSNHEIADKLHLSVNTIKVYASRIYGKLGVHSRGEAAAQARALGLLG